MTILVGWFTYYVLRYQYQRKQQSLPQPAGFALPLKKSQDVTLADGTLDVADDGTAGFVHELNLNLSNVTGVTSAAEDLEDLGELDVLGSTLLQSENKPGKY